MEIPLHALSLGGYVWALLNLILSIAGVVLGIMLIIRILLTKRCKTTDDNEDLQNDVILQEIYASHKKSIFEKPVKQSRPLVAALVFVLGLIAVTIFILTQDMTRFMVLVDMWSIVHLVLFIAGLVCYIMAFKRAKACDDDNKDDNKDSKTSFFKKIIKGKAIVTTMIAVLLLLSVFAEPTAANSGNDTISLHIYKFWNQEPPGPYMVTFDAQGGTLTPERQTVPHGGYAIEPADPVRDRHKFIGWYDFNGKPWNFNSDAVTASVTLYAIWEYEFVLPEMFLVHFESNGGTPVSGQFVDSGDFISMPDDPYRDRHRFDGWYLDPSFRGQPWDFRRDVVYQDLVLYAKWVFTETRGITYDPGFMGKGSGHYSEQALFSTYSLKNSDEANVHPPFDGFVLESWNTRMDGMGVRYEIGQPITVTTNLLLYAQWVPGSRGVHSSPLTTDIDISTEPPASNDIANIDSSNTQENTQTPQITQQIPQAPQDPNTSTTEQEQPPQQNPQPPQTQPQDPSQEPQQALHNTPEVTDPPPTPYENTYED